MKIYEFNKNILKDLRWHIVKSRGKNIRIIILIIPGTDRPKIHCYDVLKPIQFPRMLSIEIRELTDVNFVATKSFHQLSYSDILDSQND